MIEYLFIGFILGLITGYKLVYDNYDKIKLFIEAYQKGAKKL